MNGVSKASKGASLEEVLRSYFLRSGFFVIRGVPFRLADEDLTDVDLWLYERPTGTSRRVQICDIKYKQRPKAVERLLWTKGLAAALGVDDAYVATTDKRRALHNFARQLNLQLIDGNDLARIQASQALSEQHRITDEELDVSIRSVDAEMRRRTLAEARLDVVSSLSEGFGAQSVVRALGAFSRLSEMAVSFHPGSAAAHVAVRLSYLASAIACVSLDYVSAQGALRPIEDRRKMVLDAVRLGALGSEEGQRNLRFAVGLVEKYLPSGRSAARALERGLKADLDKIPAEIVADQAIRQIKTDQLFSVAKELEAGCYAVAVPAFDSLSVSARAMLGALLDFCGTDRTRFNRACETEITSATDTHVLEQAALFAERQAPNNTSPPEDEPDSAGISRAGAKSE